MKTARKTLASLLSLLMVLSCCTVLFPAFAGAEGQNDDVVTKAVINIGAVNDNGWGKDNYPAYIYYGKDANCASAVGGNWFTWWYKTRWTWNAESHSFVATALSSNGDTAYESWVLDDYEFVSMIYSGTETYADDRDALMNVAVGDKAWIYGFDFTNEKDNALIADGVSSVKLALGEKLAEGEPFDIAEETPCPGYFTDVDNPELHGLDNLARAEGTSITYNNVDASGTYTGDIADGTVGDQLLQRIVEEIVERGVVLGEDESVVLGLRVGQDVPDLELGVVRHLGLGHGVVHDLAISFLVQDVQNDLGVSFLVADIVDSGDSLRIFRTGGTGLNGDDDAGLVQTLLVLDLAVLVSADGLVIGVVGIREVSLLGALGGRTSTCKRLLL